MGKAKPAKHTAAEIAGKSHAALTNMGGGKAGLEDRQGGKAGHIKYSCNICRQPVPDLKSGQMHFESKHPKETFDPALFTDRHAEFGGQTTVGVAVRGSLKKK